MCMCTFEGTDIVPCAFAVQQHLRCVLVHLGVPVSQQHAVVHCSSRPARESEISVSLYSSQPAQHKFQFTQDV